METVGRRDCEREACNVAANPPVVTLNVGRTCMRPAAISDDWSRVFATSRGHVAALLTVPATLHTNMKPSAKALALRVDMPKQHYTAIWETRYKLIHVSLPLYAEMLKSQAGVQSQSPWSPIFLKQSGSSSNIRNSYQYEFWVSELILEFRHSQL